MVQPKCERTGIERSEEQDKKYETASVSREKGVNLMERML